MSSILLCLWITLTVNNLKECHQNMDLSFLFIFCKVTNIFSYFDQYIYLYVCICILNRLFLLLSSRKFTVWSASLIQLHYDLQWYLLQIIHNTIGIKINISFFWYVLLNLSFLSTLSANMGKINNYSRYFRKENGEGSVTYSRSNSRNDLPS